MFSTSSTVTVSSKAVTHFAIIVPGTGPHTEDEKPKGGFMKKAQKFREICRDICEREFAEAGANIEMTPIHFHADVHALKTTGGRMNKVTLPSIPWIRTMDNDVVGDILYYFSTYHGRAMLRIVTEKLNAAYDAFMEQHPYFNGPISLIAHSLGGMICYEILYYQKLRSLAHKQHCKISQLARVEHERYVELPKLKFTPTRLFTMGSPHGGTFVFRHLDFDTFNIAPIGFHNIFHPYDPFGYRTEPLVDDEFADSPAVPIVSQPVEPFVKRQSLTGSVAEFGRSLVDSAMTAPQTISSGMLKAARTSVTLPFTAVSSIMGSTGSSSHHTPVRSNTSPMTTAVSDNDADAKTRRRSRISSNIKGFFKSSKTMTVVEASSAAEESNQKPQQNPQETQTTGRRDLHNQLQGNHDENTHGTGDIASNLESQAEETQGVIYDEPMAISSQSTDKSISSSSTPVSRSESASTEGSLTRRNWNNRARVSRRSMSFESTTALYSTTSAGGALRASSAEPGSRMIGQRSHRPEDGDLEMMSHLRHIFRPTMPPSEDQRLAETQGLPLSSRLMTIRRPRIRNTQTMPATLHDTVHNDEQVEHKLAQNSQSDTRIAPSVSNESKDEEESGIAGYLAASLLAYGSRTDGESETEAEMARRNSLSAVPDAKSSSSGGLDDYTAWRPSLPTLNDDAVPEEQTGDGVVTSAETTVSEGDDMVSKLPYGERMDYIVPFSKKHLQNEYWLGMQAHFSYWTSKEVMHHIVFNMIANSD
ncbi:hypothetical protein EC988_001497 [Linderina pennispora]|nr:hypothetical protein EC988_001497 [Linderina pennispora]